MVAVFLVEGFELVEAMGTVDILRRAKIDVDTISIFNEDEVLSSSNVRVLVDKKMKDINIQNYEVLVLPGGPGTSKYLESKELLNTIKKNNKEGKKLAAICAAPSIFEKVGILENKKATSYPGFLQILSNETVVKDDNILTAKAVAYSLDFALELVEMIKGKELKDKLYDSIRGIV